MVGHATLLVQIAGLNILTDPVWSDRASPVAFAGPRRVTSPGIELGALPQIDAILPSHNHYDHLDMASLQALHARHAPLIVTPLGNDALLRRRIPSERIEVVDWDDHFEIAPGARADKVCATHCVWRATRHQKAKSTWT